MRRCLGSVPRVFRGAGSPQRGQMEMIGLVFIVIILVLGIFLYVKLGTPGIAPSRDVEVQGGTSFLVALAETSLCGTTFQRVAAACAEGKAFCASGDPCGEVQSLMDAVAAAALDTRGIKYNLSIEGTDVGAYTPDCLSADPAVDLIATPGVEIVLSAGRGTRRMTLALCE